MHTAAEYRAIQTLSRVALVFVTAFMFGTTVQAGLVTYETDPVTGRLSRATFEDGSYITYSYDSNGNRTRADLTLSPDTQPPTAPTGLTATIVSATRIDLAWTGSTDNRGAPTYRVERCSGAGCNSFGEVSQPTATLLQDAGLTSGTSYSYRVRAVDAANNFSGYSNVETRQTPDNIAPSTPGQPTMNNVTATGAGATWAASTDNVGVTGYEYSLNGGSWTSTGSASASYTLSGLTNGTTYTFAVRARDLAGNVGNSSPSRAFSTTDTSAPTTPGTPTIGSIANTTASATWTASTDNVGVTGYQYSLNGGAWTDTGSASASFNLTGLAAGTAYTFAVRARDNANNVSAASGNASFSTTGGTDTTAPTTPGQPTIGSITVTGASATWAASTDGVGVTGYEYSLSGGTWTATGSASAAYTISGVAPNSGYTFAVRARDAAGNRSSSSPSRSFTTLADTSAPSAPGQPTFSGVSASGATASWTGSTDNVAVTGYEYSLNGGTWTATGSTSTAYTFTGLTNGTSYSVSIRARDAAGNTSTPSASNSFQTTDSAAPTTPGQPGFSGITASSAVATWNASTDNVGVTGYDYSLNGGAWTSTGSASASFTITGLTNGTTYTFAVRARDNAGNTSSPSASNSFTTIDNQAPSVPGQPSFSGVTVTTANANWSASSDNVGVVGYQYSLSGGAWTNTGSASTSVALGGLASTTTYSLVVRAYDNAGNPSSPSASNSFTTVDGTPPTAPGTPGFSSVTHNSAFANWGAASDNIAVTGYEYSLNGGGWTATGSASPGLNLTGLSPSSNYSLAVRARDQFGNTGSPSATNSFTTAQPPDQTAPTPPGTPTFGAVGSSGFNASWGGASDNVGVTGYEYSINGGGSWTDVGGATSAGIGSLSAGTTYTLQVRARDAAGNRGTPSSASVTTLAAITLTNRSVSTRSCASTSVTVTYQLSAAGDIVTTANCTSASTIDVGDWLAPKVGMMNGFEFRATQTSTPQCGSNVTWGQWGPIPSFAPLTIGFGTGGPSGNSATCSVSIEVRHTNNPSVILANISVTLTATMGN